MNPWEQLERLEAWVEELRTTDDEQARNEYGYEGVDEHPDRSCCLRVANKVRGDHTDLEFGAAEWLWPGLSRKEWFSFLNDNLEMSFHEIADVAIVAGITPLREALGLEPYEEDEE